MARKPSFNCLRGLAVTLLTLGALLTCAAHANAAALVTGQVDGRHEVDIPSQPLEEALYAFGAATGIEVFADGSLIIGRRSTAVKGSFTALQTLYQLLSGTGLEAQVIGAHAITLSERRPEDRNAKYRRYSATLQQAALHQLCSEADADLGTYRIAMQIWLDERGHALRLELLSSTGDPSRDQRIRDRLMLIAAGEPPVSLPQPVVMVILPRGGGDCHAFSSGAEGGQTKP